MGLLFRLVGFFGVFMGGMFIGFIIDAWTSTSLLGQITLVSCDVLLLGFSTCFAWSEG